MALQTPTAATLTERESAAHVGYSVAYLRAARRAGRGPAYIRVGRTIRYLPRDLDAWLEAHRVTPRDGETNASVVS